MKLLILLLPVLFLTVNGCLRIRKRIERCLAMERASFLFAYSNDLNYTDVKDMFWQMTKDISDYSDFIDYKYVIFATVRFDTKTKEDIVFHQPNGIKGVKSFLAAHDHMNKQQVDSSQRFDSSETGSDVLDVLERWVDSDFPSDLLCGSRVLVLMKRSPNEVEISRLVGKLREFHIQVTIAAEHPPSGGLHPETMYDLAAKTNGYCSFAPELSQAIATLPSIYQSYTHYAFNVKASNGSRGFQNDQIFLPPLKLLKTNTLNFYIAVQSTATATSFQHFVIRHNSSTYTDYNARERHHLVPGYRNLYRTSLNSFRTHNFLIDAEPGTYIVTLQTTYTAEDTILIRMCSNHFIEPWLPFYD